MLLTTQYLDEADKLADRDRARDLIGGRQLAVAPRTMPSWLRDISDINPVSHLVTATRALMGGTPATPQVLWTAAAAGVLIAVFAPLTALLYQRK